MLIFGFETASEKERKKKKDFLSFKHKKNVTEAILRFIKYILCLLRDTTTKQDN